MENFETGRLIYLILLLIAVGGYVINAVFRSPRRSAQHLLIWAFIFIGVMGAVGLWKDISATVMPRQTVLENGTIEAPLAPDGHYYLTATINGEDIRFMVDTGASDIVLTREDAARVGINPATLSFFGQAQTANGLVQTAPVRLDTLALGPIHDSNIRAIVNGGELETSLLGMSYLTRFARVELSRDRLKLER